MMNDYWKASTGYGADNYVEPVAAAEAAAPAEAAPAAVVAPAAEAAPAAAE